MTRKKTPDAAQPFPMSPPAAHPAPVPADGADETDREAEALARIAAEFDQSRDELWTAQVMLLVAQAGRPVREQWLFQVSNLLELDTLKQSIAQDQGPGRYRVRVKHGGSVRAQYDFDIGFSPRSGFKPRLSGAPNVAAPAAIPSDVPPWVAMMLERQDRLLTALAEKAAAPAQAPAAPGASPTVMLNEALTLMKSLSEAMPKPEPNIGLSMFEKGMEFAAKAAKVGGAAAETGFLDLIREAIPTIGTIIKARAGNRPAVQPGPQAPRPAAPLPPNPAPAAIPPAPKPDDMGDAALYEFIRAQLRFLVAQAGTGADPSQYADYVLERMPQGMLDQLDSVPDPIALLAQLEPGVLQHRPWFEALIANLTEPVHSGGEIDEANSVGSTGDDVRVPSNT